VKRHAINKVKRLLEYFKIDEVAKAAREHADAGRQVAIFIETHAPVKMNAFRRLNDTSGPQYTAKEVLEEMRAWAAKPKARGIDNPPPFSKGTVAIARAFDKHGITETFPSVAKEIAKKIGISDTVHYNGSVTNKTSEQGLESWMEGKIPVIIVTSPKGGTGLSMHDTTGDMPQRVQIVLSLPWTATSIEQVAGRLVRFGMAKPTQITYLFAGGIPFEQDLAARVGARMKHMAATVHGVDTEQGAAMGDFQFTTDFRPDGFIGNILEEPEEDEEEPDETDTDEDSDEDEDEEDTTEDTNEFAHGFSIGDRVIVDDGNVEPWAGVIMWLDDTDANVKADEDGVEYGTAVKDLTKKKAKPPTPVKPTLTGDTPGKGSTPDSEQGTPPRGKKTTSEPPTATRKPTPQLVEEDKPFKEGPSIEVEEGNETKITTLEGDRHDAHFAVANLFDVIPSHRVKYGGTLDADHVNAPTYTDRIHTGEFPPGAQPRDYIKDSSEQRKISDYAQNPDPGFFISNYPLASDGPPVVNKSGIAINGNGRLLILDLLRQAGNTDWYVDALNDDAQRYGLKGDYEVD